MNIAGRYQLGELLAVQWNTDMARIFPDADHRGCYQSLRQNSLGRWVPFEPALCHDYHCPRCGKQCNGYGHHQCEAR